MNASSSCGRIPMSRPSRSPSHRGIPRHAYETPTFRIRPGVTGLRFDSWPRIDEAIAFYRRFRALRDEGVIPAQLRYQIGLSFPSSAMNGFKEDFAADSRSRRRRSKTWSAGSSSG